jgi:hypothetical protein
MVGTISLDLAFRVVGTILLVVAIASSPVRSLPEAQTPAGRLQIRR